MSPTNSQITAKLSTSTISRVTPRRPRGCTERREPPDESREQIIALYRRACAHADATIDSLPLDTVGHVPWWPPEHSRVTLFHLLVHTIAEAHRHAGHADIVRELIDGSAGLLNGNDNLPPGDRAWWKRHRDRLDTVAREADEARSHGSRG